MKVRGSRALVTGANRGIGRALVLAALEANVEDIFPDPMSKQLYSQWVTDHKGVERQFASM
jgi:NAD(P)-dependent dehydrogenase (short-subunit alcohol dehydrogenase family)